MAANPSAELVSLRDPWTKLPNRSAFYRDARHQLTRAEQDAQPMVLVSLDLDGAEQVLLMFGPAQRNLLIMETGKRLECALGECGHLYQVKSDRFAILLPQLDLEGAVGVGRGLLEALREPFDIESVPFRASARFGVACYPEHGDTPEQLARASVVALHRAREAGEEYAFYDGAWDAQQKEAFALVTDLRAALECDDQLYLAFQPKIDLASDCCVGAEALVRWQHPARGPISPGEFVPLAEATGLVGPLTELVVKRSLKTLNTWRSNGWNLRLAVNLSPNVLGERDLLDEISGHLKTSGVALEEIEFEITETGIMESPQKARHALAGLRELGARIAIDDFGTGLSSLSLLTDLPVDCLKIDQSFLRSLFERSEDQAVVRAAISLGRDLGLEVVAEGIETEEVYRKLRDWKCDSGQGFYMGRPMVERDFHAWLNESGFSAQA